MNWVDTTLVAATTTRRRQTGAVRGRNKAKADAKTATIVKNQATGAALTACRLSFLEMNPEGTGTPLTYSPVKNSEQHHTCANDVLTATLTQTDSTGLGIIRVGHTGHEGIVAGASYMACCTLAAAGATC